MAAVRGKGNKSTEEKLRKLMREAGITGWRRHLPLAGRPDFAFPAIRLAVFVDGCFWHGCPRCFRLPKTNSEFWMEKIASNRARDRRSARELRRQGWRVVRIWEHALRLSPTTVVNKLRKALLQAGDA